ncbi:hypothetical protein [Actinoallomurus oryzae]|uniref:hypothetical protein n=1 Tax=Actinoallomurus oryzae TaxID=502180 RepID=UPI0031F13210
MKPGRGAGALFAGVIAAATLGALAPAAYASSGSSSLPLPGYGAMAVDDAHGHVFVSSGPTGNGIVVTDFYGRVKKTIDNEPGADGLALSADGTKLYVALSQGDGISVVDTSTLEQTARYSTGAQSCPTYLARTGALLWYGYGCENDWQGKIGKLDTSATDPAPEGDQQGDAIFDRAPLVASAPGDAGPVVAGQLTLSLSNLHVYDVKDGKLNAGPSGEVVGSNLNDVSLTSDGVTMFTASGSRDHVEAFATKDLSRDGAYATAVHPNAVTVSPDKAYLAAAPGTNSDNATGVLVYPVGGSQPVRIITGWSTDNVVATRGITWSKDLAKLFVITQPSNGTTPTLHVVSHPTEPESGGGHGGKICILFICIPIL